MNEKTITAGGTQCGRTTKNCEVMRETLISKCLDRLAECADVKYDEATDSAGWEFDRSKARKALDRLFVDLKDFAGEKQNG